MLRLPNDVFARLAISAKKVKSMKPDLDKTIAETPEPSNIEIINYEEPENRVEDFLKEPVRNNKLQQKIDEKVESIIENPEMASIKQELENIEQIYASLKSKKENPEIVERIGQKILQLKRSIREKSLV